MENGLSYEKEGLCSNGFC